MKRILAILIFAISFASWSFAQDDDVYFVPTKAQKAAEAKKLHEREQRRLQSYYEYIDKYNNDQDDASDVYRDNEDWAVGRVGQRNVDEYNRRQATPDTSYVPDAGYEEGVYTSRLIRFHSPRVGVVVSSPYYGLWVDCYDPWLTPWDADLYYSSWYGWGLSPYYYRSSFYWRYGWYDPWWSYSWGWHPGWYDHWHWGGWVPKPGGGRYLDTSRRVTAYRPSRGYNSSDGRYSSSSYRPSRDSYRPSRVNYRPSGNGHGVQNSGVTRPSRSYGNSNRNPNGVNTRTETRPSRSYGNSGTSRSSVSSPSMPSRSYGNSGGGGRSFGNSGGGRSFGGRR